MKTVYLALGLMITGHAFAATITGSIGVSLVIYSECSIDGKNPSSLTIPCAKQTETRPKITQSLLKRDAKTGRQENLVTVEW
ncbi:hypothetical protein [Erwinia pyrifoliae]|uniref:hypothetical protein n=1 Tax=Erwinia pyrifoliae TaxID=79967 RepID=UPI0001960DB9|nr:hypothetical protein [Erwinia pyrifoliae]AUX73578.1 hypothetical protein CPI84_14555 [Erwinia pyrifoliae]MCA8876119.1 hypothetical protein [Erwinia pyrifoliae]MCT2388005.1 hypothetical protein [Erwinia pyrifoliae]MCU8586175.1 hypothetical protein [Erwinia pyrifoliae]CAX54639.1 conserved uncharacterized protein [Erwinia pyrifoliae Ep1/96]